MVAMHVSGATVATRYFHTDNLGSANFFKEPIYVTRLSIL